MINIQQLHRHRPRAATSGETLIAGPCISPKDFSKNQFFFSLLAKPRKHAFTTSLHASPREKRALSVFSEISEYAIQSLVTTVCPERGPRKLGREGGLEEAVVEDFWVYYVQYAAEGRARIYGDMPEFWGSSSSSLGERVCGGRYLGYTVELMMEELFHITVFCSREFKQEN